MLLSSLGLGDSRESEVFLNCLRHVGGLRRRRSETEMLLSFLGRASAALPCAPSCREGG